MNNYISSISGKRILITGGNGFLGKNIVNMLNDNNTIFIPRSRDYNLVNEQDVKRMFNDFKNIDILIHAAADVGGIGYSSSNSAKQYMNNILINTYVLHYAWENKVGKFVGIGSVCEYPANTPIPFVEKELWNGYPVVTNDAYGFSKRMLYAQSIMYKRDYNFNTIHLLPVNLYGPGDDFSLDNSHVIPAMIRKIYSAKITNASLVEVWGTGKESREFIYVKDAAKGIVLASEKYNKIDAVNIGSGYEITISQLCDLLANIMDYRGTFKYLNNGLGGQNRRMLDVSKAQLEFDFHAETDFRQGLQETVEYFYKNTNEIMNSK